MLTDFRLNKELCFDEIFDGRLDRYGVHDTSVAEPNPWFRCLTDGNNIVWVEVTEPIEFLIGFGTFDAKEKILTAIAEVFEVEISSEHLYQYWEFDLNRMCLCYRKDVAEEVQFKMNNLIMKHVRSGHRHFELCSSLGTVVNIAKYLMIENPDLASPEREAELLEKTYKRREAIFNRVTSLKIDIEDHFPFHT